MRNPTINHNYPFAYSSYVRAKEKMAEKKSKASAAGQISDARFAKFESDPRFRLPSKKATKAKLDKRFSRVLKDKDFTATTQVDRYGRKLKSDKKKKALERLYEVEDEDDDDDDKEDSDDGLKKAKAKATTYDAARGGGFSASESDSDDSDSDGSDDSGQDSDEGAGGADTQQFREEEAAVATGEVTRRIAIVNLDWDYVKSRDLMAMFSSFVPKDGRGRIERISIYPSQFGKERMQREELEGPPREIFKKKDDSSDSESDSEDDSEEESDDDSEDGSEESEDDEKVKQDLLREEDDQDFDSNELRTYQLDRLRYYYAVMTCTDAETAEAIYRATDGREYQASSNFIDLRFVPDETSFDDDEPRDECTEVPVNYKPVDFVTRALQHSKVKLTWDIHPEESARKDMARKAFSGTPSELIENDLRAYLASDSDGSDEDGDDGEVFEGIQEVDATGDGSDDKDADDAEPAEPAPRLSKKEQARQKMRAALGLAEEPTKSSGGKKAPVGGMQITFTPALSDGAAAKKSKAGEDETTIEKYKRKEKERKELRKQKAVAKREGRDPDAVAETDAPAVADAAAGEDEEDLGFDDPFFFTEDAGAAADAPTSKSKTAVRKEERLQKRAAREAEAKEKEDARAHLEAIMGDELDIAGQDSSNKTGHFDLREVMRAEKLRKKEERRKNRNKRTRHDDDDASGGDDAAGAAGADAARQTHLGVDVSDPRLQAIFDQPDFAIDPSNAQFKDTIGLQQVLNEARRKRKGGADAKDGDASATSSKKAKTAKTATSERDNELANLVNSVKRKAKRNANN